MCWPQATDGARCSSPSPRASGCHVRRDCGAHSRGLVRRARAGGLGSHADSVSVSTPLHPAVQLQLPREGRGRRALPSSRSAGHGGTPEVPDAASLPCSLPRGLQVQSPPLLCPRRPRSQPVSAEASQRRCHVTPFPRDGSGCCRPPECRRLTGAGRDSLAPARSPPVLCSDSTSPPRTTRDRVNRGRQGGLCQVGAGGVRG